jgi:hypothetical protein
MKTYSLFSLIFLSLNSCNQPSKQTTADGKKPISQLIDTSDMTNNFYDNTETYALPVRELNIDGEIANPCRVDFTTLPIHSVIVKETLRDRAINSVSEIHLDIIK